MRFLLFLLAALYSSITSAQPYFQTLSVPVSKNNTLLKNPWVGGLDAPQFSPVNWNNDGIEDLFVFDRSGNKAYTFIGKGNGVYEYAPVYERTLPYIENWALIRDFNKDGAPDIFCWANGGIRVYRGKRVNGMVEYEFITGKYDSSGNLLTDLLTFTNYSAPNYPKVNIYVLTDDIPGLVDVNGDGDLDIVSFSFFASSAEYYENQSVEQGFGADSLIFDSYNLDLCWGKFFEGSFTNTISLGQCKQGGMEGSEAARHAGSTICLFDKDGDGDQDLLLGDIAYNTMIYLLNGGDSAEANMVSYDTIFPAYNTPINMPVFPAAFIVDADHDGVNDLLVSPNARGALRNIKNVMFYKNVGSNTNYDFRYQTDSFLVEGMLDFGTNSKVAVFDYNGDGLMDIFIGNDTYYLQQFQTQKSQVALLENIGSPTSPAFKLVTEDYANIGNFLLRQVQPAFGDLDGDGKQDLLIGDFTGYMHFFKNTGGTVANFSSMTTPQYFAIDATVNAAPFIFDVDEDGDNDLVVGIRNGTLNWYINYGTNTLPQFSEDSVVKNFGMINLRGQYEVEGSAQPFLMKQNDSIIMFCGSNRGSVYKYHIEPAQLRGGAFTLLDSNVLGKTVGQKSTIGIADFNADGKPDFIVGNSLGGLNFFSSTQIDPSSVVESGTKLLDWKVYPNPARDMVWIDLQNGSKGTLEVYSSDGRLMVQAQVDGKTQVKLEGLSQGIYLLRMSSGERISTKRIAVIR